MHMKLNRDLGKRDERRIPKKFQRFRQLFRVLTFVVRNLSPKIGEISLSNFFFTCWKFMDFNILVLELSENKIRISRVSSLTRIYVLHLFSTKKSRDENSPPEFFADAHHRNVVASLWKHFTSMFDLISQIVEKCDENEENASSSDKTVTDSCNVEILDFLIFSSPLKRDSNSHHHREHLEETRLGSDTRKMSRRKFRECFYC